MTIKLTIVGAGGRLGSAIAREAIQDERFELVGGVVRSDSDHVEKDLGELAGTDWIGRTSVIRLEDALEGADVVIDASAPETSAAIARRLADLGGPALICGVTGLSADQTDALHLAAERMPVLASRNFSIGIALVEMLVATAAAGLPMEKWDAEISETHHRYKADAPSGTAMILGETIAKARQQILDMVAERGRSTRSGRRTPGTIGFASQRGGAVIGDHDVRFLGDFEEISISHRAFDRRVFAIGALTASQWLLRQKPGLYAMRDIIGG
ncbi:4-hydroxy-tetrahydrodipicolinate reductase [Hyphobacterium sp. HN65]|uniref:4-hydroxy-tetrahydrodipicolinate reductase n=1 Tax=Hyphobacterium lacteum TaxID=3116575 RepID=A0ABU7LRV7_9PROT|nr:4-hydroxy-tetrahydrodipicolinate reductase [Hyphobacterium sp. HN65]MEE2526653.1 4-hydroxy-tetrahydrodipicolinate reductase [Hyphobacterium sp. HN65]